MNISKTRVLELIQESLDSLHRGGFITTKIDTTPATVLLGSGSNLDSIGFVTFVADFEEKLTQEAGKDVFVVFNEIQDLNINNPHLSCDTFSNYIVQLFKGLG